MQPATGCKSGIVPLSALVSIRSVRGPSAYLRQAGQIRGAVSEARGLVPTFPCYLSILVAVILNMADTMDEGTV